MSRAYRPSPIGRDMRTGKPIRLDDAWLDTTALTPAVSQPGATFPMDPRQPSQDHEVERTTKSSLGGTPMAQNTAGIASAKAPPPHWAMEVVKAEAELAGIEPHYRRAKHRLQQARDYATLAQLDIYNEARAAQGLPHQPVNVTARD